MELITEAERAAGVFGYQDPAPLVQYELLQAEETGHDVRALRMRAEEIIAAGADPEALAELYDVIPQTPAEGWTAFESSSLDDIAAVLPPASDRPLRGVDRLEDRMLGAWTGRVAGNMLGKPLELGWPRHELAAHLRARGEYPLRDWVEIPVEAGAERLRAQGWIAAGQVDYAAVGRDRIDGGARDDDIDYTVLGLHLLERYGADLTTWDVARSWLELLPVYKTYTAERAVYQNLVRGIPVGAAADVRNPYREWIGALIRADAFAYAHPGAPRRAALLSHRDAILSHRANGLYGELWAAALVSSAFVAPSPEWSIRESLRHIPPTSRLADEIRAVLADFAAGRSWEHAIAGVEARHPTMDWVHTISNAGALTAAILWGDGDLGPTIGNAAQSGLDADSIGATAGSWVGAFVGADALPAAWIEPLHGMTRSAIFGYAEVRFDDLAARSVAVARALE